MKKFILAGACIAILSGCFDGDDDPVVVPAPEVNNAPVPISEMLTTQTELAIEDSLTATDADNDPLTFALVTPPQLGELSLNQDGSYTYQPRLEVTGIDSFEFSVSDGVAQPQVAIIEIRIEALTVSFTQSVRDAFAQAANTQPLRVNGRDYIDDALTQDTFADLLDK